MHERMGATPSGGAILYGFSIAKEQIQIEQLPPASNSCPIIIPRFSEI